MSKEVASTRQWIGHPITPQISSFTAEQVVCSMCTPSSLASHNRSPKFTLFLHGHSLQYETNMVEHKLKQQELTMSFVHNHKQFNTTGLDDPDLLKDRTEVDVGTTPYGEVSDVLITGTISDVPCVLLARHGRK